MIGAGTVYVPALFLSVSDHGYAVIEDVPGVIGGHSGGNMAGYSASAAYPQYA